MNDLYYEREASLSPCGGYRWTLTHNWDPGMRRPWVGWIMLNPSTADADTDDPTIRRVVGFSRAWGFGGMTVRNLFTFRATDPAALRSCPDPVGAGTDRLIRTLPEVCPLVVCAWGAGGGYLGRDRRVMEILRSAGANVVCLGTTKDGHPRHPLYVPANVQPVPFSLPEVTS